MTADVLVPGARPSRASPRKERPPSRSSCCWALLMTEVLGQTLTARRIKASTPPMRYVIQDAGGTAKLRTIAMIATDSLSANRRIAEAWTAGPAMAIASVGRVPAGTGLRLKPKVRLSRWLITARPPRGPGYPDWWVVAVRKAG